MIGDCSCHLLSILVLTKIVNKISIRSNEIHDDGVVNLESMCVVETVKIHVGMRNGNRTNQVVLVIVCWSHTVVDSIRLGHLVYLLFGASQTDQAWMELLNKINSKNKINLIVISKSCTRITVGAVGYSSS